MSRKPVRCNELGRGLALHKIVSCANRSLPVSSCQEALTVSNNTTGNSMNSSGTVYPNSSNFSYGVFPPSPSHYARAAGCHTLANLMRHQKRTHILSLAQQRHIELFIIGAMGTFYATIVALATLRVTSQLCPQRRKVTLLSLCYLVHIIPTKLTAPVRLPYHLLLNAEATYPAHHQIHKKQHVALMQLVPVCQKTTPRPALTAGCGEWCGLSIGCPAHAINTTLTACCRSPCALWLAAPAAPQTQASGVGRSAGDGSGLATLPPPAAGSVVPICTLPVARCSTPWRCD